MARAELCRTAVQNKTVNSKMENGLKKKNSQHFAMRHLFLLTDPDVYQLSANRDRANVPFNKQIHNALSSGLPQPFMCEIVLVQMEHYGWITIGVSNNGTSSTISVVCHSLFSACETLDEGNRTNEWKRNSVKTEQIFCFCIF